MEQALQSQLVIISEQKKKLTANADNFQDIAIIMNVNWYS